MTALSVLFLFASPALGQFIYVNTAKNWDTANEWCATKYGTTLATIKNDYDAALLKEKERLVGSFWIGINDLSREGLWEWASGYQCEDWNCDGEDWWFSGEPNSGSAYDCGFVTTSATTAQNLVQDATCTTSMKFMCDAPAVIDASTFGVATGWEDYMLYAVAALNVVMLTCLAVFCLCTQQTAKYGKVASYDSDSKL